MKKENGKGTSIAIIFVVLLFGGMLLYFMISGILVLTSGKGRPIEEAFAGMEAGQIYEGNTPEVIGHVGSIKHSANFIPAGTENFFLIASEDHQSVILVRAYYSWYEDYLDGYFVHQPTYAKGQVRKIDRNIYDLFGSGLADIREKGYQVDVYYYLDYTCQRLALFKLLDSLGILFCVVYLILFTKVNKRLEPGEPKPAITSPKLGIGVLVLFLVSIGLFIYIMNMI